MTKLFESESSIIKPSQITKELLSKFDSEDKYVYLQGKSSDIPTPWDNAITDCDDQFIYCEGGITAGGPEAGDCKLKIKRSKIDNFYDLIIEE